MLSLMVYLHQYTVMTWRCKNCECVVMLRQSALLQTSQSAAPNRLLLRHSCYLVLPDAVSLVFSLVQKHIYNMHSLYRSRICKYSRLLLHVLCVETSRRESHSVYHLFISNILLQDNLLYDLHMQALPDGSCVS